MFNDLIKQIDPTITAVTLLTLLNVCALAPLVVIARRGGVLARALQ